MVGARLAMLQAGQGKEEDVYIDNDNARICMLETFEVY